MNVLRAKSVRCQKKLNENRMNHERKTFANLHRTIRLFGCSGSALFNNTEPLTSFLYTQNIHLIFFLSLLVYFRQRNK